MKLSAHDNLRISLLLNRACRLSLDVLKSHFPTLYGNDVQEMAISHFLDVRNADFLNNETVMRCRPRSALWTLGFVETGLDGQNPSPRPNKKPHDFTVLDFVPGSVRFCALILDFDENVFLT